MTVRKRFQIDAAFELVAPMRKGINIVAMQLPFTINSLKLLYLYTTCG
jgi:hypothetical protein